MNSISVLPQLSKEVLLPLYRWGICHSWEPWGSSRRCWVWIQSQACLTPWLHCLWVTALFILWVSVMGLVTVDQLWPSPWTSDAAERILELIWLCSVLGRENASSGDLVALYLFLGADVQTFQETSGICIMHWIQSALLNMGSQKHVQISRWADRSSHLGAYLSIFELSHWNCESHLTNCISFRPRIPLNWEQFSRGHRTVFLCHLFHVWLIWIWHLFFFWQNLPHACFPLFPFSPPRNFKLGSCVSECLVVTVQKDSLTTEVG